MMTRGKRSKKRDSSVFVTIPRGKRPHVQPLMQDVLLSSSLASQSLSNGAILSSRSLYDVNGLEEGIAHSACFSQATSAPPRLPTHQGNRLFSSHSHMMPWAAPASGTCGMASNAFAVTNSLPSPQVTAWSALPMYGAGEEVGFDAGSPPSPTVTLPGAHCPLATRLPQHTIDANVEDSPPSPGSGPLNNTSASHLVLRNDIGTHGHSKPNPTMFSLGGLPATATTQLSSGLYNPPTSLRRKASRSAPSPSPDVPPCKMRRTEGGQRGVRFSQDATQFSERYGNPDVTGYPAEKFAVDVAEPCSDEYDENLAYLEAVVDMVRVVDFN